MPFQAGYNWGNSSVGSVRLLPRMTHSGPQSTKSVRLERGCRSRGNCGSTYISNIPICLDSISQAEKIPTLHNKLRLLERFISPYQL